jgi:hypothetical protein
MFAKLLHCLSGFAQIDLSGTLMSLDDSTLENMLELMPLGHKTLHDSNFITGKLVAIPQAGRNRDAPNVC